MKNDGLEKALELTWENKERFYEDTKGLAMVEIIKGIEKKYAERGSPHRRNLARPPELYQGETVSSLFRKVKASEKPPPRF